MYAIIILLYLIVYFGFTEENTVYGKNIFRRDELENILDSVIGKTLGEVDTKKVFDLTLEKPKITGIAGKVMEESVLGYKSDNKQEADLIVDGIETELKTTGLK